MTAVNAKIVYETGKNAYEELQIVMQKYKPILYSSFSEWEQRYLSLQQKIPDELYVEFYIMTYSGPVLKSDGQFVSEQMEDVRMKMNDIKKLKSENGELHRQPICKIQWGEESFRGILSYLDYRYTMFAKNGTPVCVNCAAVFMESIDIDEVLKNDNTPQSPDRSKYRMIYENTRLCQMAYQEYDDPGCWRLIAEANGIIDPLDLTAGKLLALPPDH